MSEPTDSHQAQPAPVPVPQPTQEEALARLQAAIATRPDLLAQLQAQKMQRLKPQPVPANRPDALPFLIFAGLLSAFGITSVIMVSLPRTGEARMAEAIAAMSIEQARRPRTQITCVFGCGDAVRELARQQQEPIAQQPLDPRRYAEWVGFWGSVPPSELKIESIPGCSGEPECKAGFDWAARQQQQRSPNNSPNITTVRSY